MNKTLVIVESPGKINKINEYLGNEYIVKASYGHVRDLNKTSLSIEVDNNFNPIYCINNDKHKTIKELKDLKNKCNDVILATDGDREGEAIAYSLAEILKIKNPKRIIFHEITKKALEKAINNITTINYNMVYAQQARRILDRLVGYKISPLLWHHVNKDTKSAGRVQSVIVKIIVDNENKIKNTSLNMLYKNIFNFTKDNYSIDGKLSDNIIFKNKEEILIFINKLNINSIYKVKDIINKKVNKKPPIPFITSSLQQEAFTVLHFSISKVMQLAQKLYEKGYITYMRSDCPNISQDAINSIQKYIIDNYGSQYSEPKNYSSKKSTSQDAHECIRPTKITVLSPNNLDNDSINLYKLIWKRTIASQMSSAIYNNMTIIIDIINNSKSIFKNDEYIISIYESIDFVGYLIIYDKKESETINININDILTFINLKIYEDYNNLPLRYNEAGLVKYLEKNSIGRPSTYTSIISKILERNYVEIKDIKGTTFNSNIYEIDNKYILKEYTKEINIGNEYKKIVPTENGIKVNDFMLKYFDNIIDIDFTAKLELLLDKIAIGQANWITVLQNFYSNFEPIINNLNIIPINTNTNDNLLGEINNQQIFKGTGKYGPYVKTYLNNKWIFSSIKDNININIEDAYELLQYPKYICKIKNKDIYLNKGKYGYYINYNNKNYSVKNNDIDINDIKKLLNI